MAMALVASASPPPSLASSQEPSPRPSRTFKVTFRVRGNPEERVVVEVGEDEYIAEAAERKSGLALPQSCRSGACSACAALLLSGRVEHSVAQTFLSDRQIARGFVLTCIAYPVSDLVLDTHQEALLYCEDEDSSPPDLA